MTDKPTNKSGADAKSGSALVTFGPSDEEVTFGPTDEQADLPEEFDEIDDDLTEGDDDDTVGDSALGNGAVSGGFGFAGLALAVVSLTTNWTSGVVVSHSQYDQEVHAGSSGLTAQQSLNMYANGWHTQGFWALVFAAAAVLCGAGALLWPSTRPGAATPGWAKAAATGAIIVGLVGALLAVLTITGVFGGHLTVPTSTG